MTRLSLVFACSLAACSGSPKHPEDMAVAADMPVPDLGTPTYSLSFCLNANPGVDGGAADGGGQVDFEGITYSILGTEFTGSIGGGDGCYSIDNAPAPLAGGAPIPIAVDVTQIADTQGNAYQDVTLLGATFPPSSAVSWTFASANLLTTTQAQAYYSAGGLTYPSSSTGFIIVVIANANTHAPAAGATATLSPASGKVVYADATGTLDPALTSTTSSGTVVFGNVTPGNFTVTVNAPGLTCNWELLANAPQLPTAWPGTGTNAAAGKVAAGSVIDALEMNCQ